MFYPIKIQIPFGMTESDLEQMDDMDLNLAMMGFQRFSLPKKKDAKELFISMAKSDGYADPRELKIIDDLFQ